MKECKRSQRSPD